MAAIAQTGLHSEYLDYQDKGDLSKGRTQILRDEPDEVKGLDSTLINYSNYEHEITIIRTPKRIIIQAKIYDPDEGGAGAGLEILVIPSIKIVTIKIEGNTPYFLHYGSPFALIDFCRAIIKENFED